MSDTVWIVVNPEGRVIGSGVKFATALDEAFASGDIATSDVDRLRFGAYGWADKTVSPRGFTLMRVPAQRGSDE